MFVKVGREGKKDSVKLDGKIKAKTLEKIREDGATNYKRKREREKKECR